MKKIMSFVTLFALILSIMLVIVPASSVSAANNEIRTGYPIEANGVYRIKNLYSGKYLTAVNALGADGLPRTTNFEFFMKDYSTTNSNIPYSKNENQLWKLIPQSNGTYKLMAYSKYTDSRGYFASLGSSYLTIDKDTWTQANAPNFRIELQSNNNGYTTGHKYTIISTNDNYGLCYSESSYGYYRTGGMQYYPYYTYMDQQYEWEFIKCDNSEL